MRIIQRMVRSALFPALFLALVCWAGAAPQQVDARIWMDASINGKPARLFFDTGASDVILFPKGAKRLGLSFTNPLENVVLGRGQVPTGTTEECDFAIGLATVRRSLHVFMLPSMLDAAEDGVIGWGAVQSNIMVIDAVHGTVTCIEVVPREAAEWTKLPLCKDSRILRLEWPARDGKLANLAIDTGSSHGVQLAPDLWRAWSAAHTNQPRTLDAYYTPLAGLVVAEEAWAKELSCGPLILTDLPVKSADKADLALAPPSGYEGTLGLSALKRMDLILDGKKGFAYVRPRQTTPPAYSHNRLGAVFVPVDLQSSDDLIAHVMQGSPAHQTGVRAGDLLLKIDDLDVTKWRTDPEVLPLSRFFSRPAGTKLSLTLKRGTETFKATAVLREILYP